MSEFGLNIANCRRNVGQFSEMRRQIIDLQGDVNEVIRNLNSTSLRRYVSLALQGTSQEVGTLESQMERLETALSEIIQLYEQTESKIAGAMEQIGNNSPSSGSGNTTWLGEYSIDSILFDEDGSYGGDQGNMDRTYKWDPIRCWELLRDLREYYPHMSIFDAFHYFSHLNRVGCGYVALANTLFVAYEGRPEDFERTFGYPMYNHGDLNYDRLILDIYATTDLDGFNDESDGHPGGTNDASRAEIMENFLNNREITVTTVADASITKENFQNITEEKGYVILGYRYGNMYDESGNAHYINGGHAIMVTGVTDDGRFTVSSWGEKYYINPSDIGSDDSFMVFYYNS